MISEKSRKDIKNLTCLKSSLNSALPAVIENNIALTNPHKSANGFNKYFINISSTAQFSIKFSRKEIMNSFVIQTSIFFSLRQLINQKSIFFLSINQRKTIDPNDVPKKILKLLSNDMQNHLIELFNLFPCLRVFPSKWISNLHFLTIAQHLILTKYLEDLCITASMNSWDPIISLIINNLHFDKNISLLMHWQKKKNN